MFVVVVLNCFVATAVVLCNIGVMYTIYETVTRFTRLNQTCSRIDRHVALYFCHSFLTSPRAIFNRYVCLMYDTNQLSVCIEYHI